MGNFITNLIINILLMAFAIISVMELIYDKSIKGRFYNKINRRGWFLIVIAFLTILFNLFKDWQTSVNEEKYLTEKAHKDSLLQQSQEELRLLQISTKDSIIKRVDSTYVKSIKASNDALAKYNLIMTDSLNSVINKLKLESDKPQLILAPLEKGKQSAFLSYDTLDNKFHIQFISKGGTSYNIKLICLFLEELNGDSYNILDAQVISFGNNLLTEDVVRTESMPIKLDILSHTNVLVFLTGSFSKDPEGKFTIQFDDIFKFNFKENKFISRFEMNFEKLKRILKVPQSI